MACLSACSKETEYDITGNAGKMEVRLSSTGPEEESVINDATGLLFRDGMLREIITPEASGSEGIYIFRTSEKSGQIYILANAGKSGILAGLSPGSTSESSFLELSAGTSEMTADGLMMTGSLNAGQMSGPAAVNMTRCVARLDMAIAEKGVKVLKAEVSGIADRGYVIPRGEVSVPGSAEMTGSGLDFTGEPLENGRYTLMYMPEQSAAGAEVEITAGFGGGTHTFRAPIPKTIVRNNIYTVNVHGSGASISVAAYGEDWEDGSQSGSVTSPGGLIDIADSTIPEGVSISEGRDSVFVSHEKASFRLAIMAEEGTVVKESGAVPGVSIQVSGIQKSGLRHTAYVSVESARRFPGRKQETIYLDVFRADTLTGRIVAVFQAHPVKIDGLLELDSEGKCEFGKYVDGELGFFTLPEGKVLEVEFDQGEARWMKVVEVSAAGMRQHGPGSPDEGPERNAGQMRKAAVQKSAGKAAGQKSAGENAGRMYRLLGGWKPNDPEADGRVQSGRLVIRNEDGTERETYPVSRLNWSLPVVRIGDNWWMKYNLRGNAKSFSDQVTIMEDPAAQEDVVNILSSIPEDGLLALMGHQYQGGNPQGLPLKHDGSAFYYEGMSSSALDFGSLPPDQMAPDGFMIPDHDQIAFFTGSDNYNLGGVGTRPFNNTTGQRLSISISERQVSFLGHEYGTVVFYDFSYQGQHWVLYGLGHQRDTAPGSISRMDLLLATSGEPSKSWMMEGYTMADRPGQNWLKYVNADKTRTRMIRCIKTPVEYIYE